MEAGSEEDRKQIKKSAAPSTKNKRPSSTSNSSNNMNPESKNSTSSNKNSSTNVNSKKGGDMLSKGKGGGEKKGTSVKKEEGNARIVDTQKPIRNTRLNSVRYFGTKSLRSCKKTHF